METFVRNPPSPVWPPRFPASFVASAKFLLPISRESSHTDDHAKTVVGNVAQGEVVEGVEGVCLNGCLDGDESDKERVGY